jgi:hypothetical protein
MKQLASTSSLQMTSCSKPHGFLNFLQVVLSGLLQIDICRLDATCFINLHQVCKCQLAACLISIGLLQVDAVNKPAATC